MFSKLSIANMHLQYTNKNRYDTYVEKRKNHS